MNKFIKKLIKLSIFGALVFWGWQAKLKWEEFKPVLVEFEEKDPEKYAKMVEEAQSFQIKETRRLYRELDRMTFAAVIDLRYRRFLEKRKSDKKYREDSYDEDGNLIEADHPYGWKSYSEEIDGDGVHSFFGLKYNELKF